MTDSQISLSVPHDVAMKIAHEQMERWQEALALMAAEWGHAMNAVDESAPEDPAEALRELADDLEADAHEFDVTESREGSVVTGLGRAVGKARERAKQIDGKGEHP